MHLRRLFVLVLSLLLCSCDEKQMPQEVAEDFLSAYLDCRFAAAEKLAVQEMAEQLRWRASQLTQAEVEMLAEQAEASVTTDAVEEDGDDCLVWLTATDALLLDSIGQPGHVGEARYRVRLKKGNGSNWKVTAVSPNL